MTVERPLRIEGADPDRACKPAEIRKLRESGARSETAPPVIRKVHKRGVDADPLRGLFAAVVDGAAAVVEYEPDAELRDTERVSLLEDGGVEAFFRRETLPYAPDAWIDDSKTAIGYEIGFNRHFHKPKPLRTLEEIEADIRTLEKETEGLLDDLLTGCG